MSDRQATLRCSGFHKCPLSRGWATPPRPFQLIFCSHTGLLCSWRWTATHVSVSQKGDQDGCEVEDVNSGLYFKVTVLRANSWAFENIYRHSPSPLSLNDHCKVTVKISLRTKSIVTPLSRTFNEGCCESCTKELRGCDLITFWNFCNWYFSPCISSLIWFLQAGHSLWISFSHLKCEMGQKAFQQFLSKSLKPQSILYCLRTRGMGQV